MLGCRHNGDAGTLYPQLNRQFARLSPDRTAACWPKATGGTAEIGQGCHHAVLHCVTAHPQHIAIEIGGDDEHARQIGVRTPFGSMLGMSRSSDVGTHGDGGNTVADTDEWIVVPRLKYGRLGRRHDAIATVATRTRRESSEPMFRVKPNRALRGEDERSDAEGRLQPDRRSDNQKDALSRHVEQREQARVVLRARQASRTCTSRLGCTSPATGQVCATAIERNRVIPPPRQRAWPLRRLPRSGGGQECRAELLHGPLVGGGPRDRAADAPQRVLHEDEGEVQECRRPPLAPRRTRPARAEAVTCRARAPQDGCSPSIPFLWSFTGPTPVRTPGARVKDGRRPPP